MKQRILITAPGFPPTHNFGAERQASRMADWLVAQGHEVEVIAVENSQSTGFRVETSEEYGFTVHRLYYDVTSDDNFTHYYDDAHLGPAIRSILEQKHFDLVLIVSGYLLGVPVIQVAHTLGLPTAIMLTEFWFMCQRLTLLQPTGALCTGPDSDEKCMRCYWESKRRFLLPAQKTPKLMNTVWSALQDAPFAHRMTQAMADRRQKLRAALDAVDLVISPSQFLIDKFAAYHFDTSNYVHVRQGLQAPAQLPQRTPGDTLRLVYVGQIQPHKGVDLPVDAVIKLLKRDYPVTLDIWGSEAQAPDYVSLLKTRSAPYPGIHWNGAYGGERVWDTLAAADVLIIPSRWYENSPSVILEAYASGIPVIGTDLGGMAELIQHDQTGLLFELNSAADLAHQIQRLVDEPELLPRLRAGIPRVKSVDMEMREIADHLTHLLKSTSL
jgi:glycosyltransferase involved in cell wall biosynthesis